MQWTMRIQRISTCSELVTKSRDAYLISGLGPGGLPQLHVLDRQGHFSQTSEQTVKMANNSSIFVNTANCKISRLNGDDQ